MYGYTLDDVAYAVRHVTDKLIHVLDGETYVKFTGLHHGDSLTPSSRDSWTGNKERNGTMANNDKVWRWDDSKAWASGGARAQAEMDALLTRAASVADPDDAVSVLLGRPRVTEEREETVKI